MPFTFAINKDYTVVSSRKLRKQFGESYSNSGAFFWTSSLTLNYISKIYNDTSKVLLWRNLRDWISRTFFIAIGPFGIDIKGRQKLQAFHFFNVKMLKKIKLCLVLLTYAISLFEIKKGRRISNVMLLKTCCQKDVFLIRNLAMALVLKVF